MKTLKIANLWTAGDETVKNSIFFKLVEQMFDGSVVISKPNQADILILGPYNLDKILNRLNIAIKKRLKINDFNFFKEIERKTFFKKNTPLTIFYCHESIRTDRILTDYSISFDLSNNPSHLRFPVWKENIDWKKEGIDRSENCFIINRFGSFYDIEKLKLPIKNFNNTKKNICIFSSHMNEPRKLFYENLKKLFTIDGFGPYFNNKIKNHNVSGFFKKNIMKDYFFNLCPHNALYPGYYEEKVPEAYLCGCIPITWADSNISIDFNPKALINLNDNFFENYNELFENLKSDTFLKSFLNEPLINYDLNLNNERKFVEKILKNFS